MREPFVELYLHIVWATWDRLPLLILELEQSIYACIKAECIKLNVEMIAIGGIEDHVHILVRVPSTIAIANLVIHLKGASSHLVTHILQHKSEFKWQGAYAAFTISKSHVPAIIAYISKQGEHHSDPNTKDNLALDHIF